MSRFVLVGEITLGRAAGAVVADHGHDPARSDARIRRCNNLEDAREVQIALPAK